MQKVTKFTNFSNEDFIGRWNAVPWKIKAGETIMLQDYLANHFAKHLIDRELNKIDEPTSNQLKRQEMLKLCIYDVDIEVESDEKAETEVLNQNSKSEAKDEQNEEEDLSKMSRKELNKIAEEEGIVEAESLPNRKSVIEMINDTRSEAPTDEDQEEEKASDEDEFEGNDKGEEK